MKIELNDRTRLIFSAIIDLQNRASKKNIIIFHLGGWAIDAMDGKITRDHNDIDFIVRNSTELSGVIDILQSMGFYMAETQPVHCTVMTNGDFEVEFGRIDDPNNRSFYNAELSESNYGYINGIRLYFVDPKVILWNRKELIRAGYKKNDEVQQNMMNIIKKYIEQAA